MDLGLQGKTAIVCAASKGLGRACAISLAREGVDLVITARTAETLEATAAEIRAMTGVKVTDEELDTVRIKEAKFHGEWNYAISPR